VNELFMVLGQAAMPLAGCEEGLKWRETEKEGKGC